MQLYVVGGDRRIDYMAEALVRKGERVTGLGLSSPHISTRPFLEGIQEADAVILGIPPTKDGKTIFAPGADAPIPIQALLENGRPACPVLCGMPTPALCAEFASFGIPLINYLDREALVLLNAVPTAEGALEIAMRQLPITIWGCKVLVTGFGRIGKYLARILSALGADVTVSARKEQDFALCRVLGYSVINTYAIAPHGKQFDLVINTIPEKILDAPVLSSLRPDVCVIDLASLPGGVDTEAARTFGISTTHALSLPGKVAPKTAGEILSDTITTILKERN